MPALVGGVPDKEGGSFTAVTVMFIAAILEDEPTESVTLKVRLSAQK